MGGRITRAKQTLALTSCQTRMRRGETLDVKPSRFLEDIPDETIVRDGEEITIRPSKPVDERRIQEHYYSLDKKDVQLRFFHDKISFDRSDVETRSQIDYIKDLTLVAVVGEFGFGKVVGVDTFGESAPAPELFEHFGFSTDNVVKVARELL